MKYYLFTALENTKLHICNIRLGNFSSCKLCSCKHSVCLLNPDGAYVLKNSSYHAWGMIGYN